MTRELGEGSERRTVEQGEKSQWVTGEQLEGSKKVL